VVVTIPVRSTGLYAKGLIVLGEQDKNIPGAAAELDRFGASIAAGDVTGDGYDDVLVGAPGDDPGGKRDAGATVLLRGSAKGLTGAKSQAVTQSTAGVPGAAEKEDFFGAAVAVLNLDGTKRLDAVITAPNETVGGDTKGEPSGSVTTMRGVAGGLNGGTEFTGRAVGLPGLSYGQDVAYR
jgi:FG-GAP repeat protein